MAFTRFMRLESFKWLPAALLILGLAACGGGKSVEDILDINAPKSFMSGDQEVPPVTTGAIGSGSFTLNPVSRRITGSLTVDGMTATSAHIHSASAGANGDVIVNLVQTSPGTWSVPDGTTLSESQASNFVSGDLYADAHSVANPNGEIRGQIGRDVYMSHMTAAQQVPPTTSTATGVGRMVVNSVDRQFAATMTLSGMTAISAHIHIGAAGTTGPVLFSLTETPAGSGVWVAPSDARLSDDQMNQLKAGNLYFDAHSAAFSNGEIRGQVGSDVGVAMLNGAQEVPPTVSPGAGTGTLVIDPTTRGVSGTLTVTGMTPSMANVDTGAPGVNGPVDLQLTNTGTGTWTVAPNTILSADNYLAYKQGNLYFNAPSPQFPNGEIRGQVH
jgi:hypothetical protein